MADALAAYDFDLPDALIAQRPAERRDGSRMLVLHRASGEIEDRHVTDLPEYLAAGDALVLNDTRVLAARLVGQRPTGGKAEIFLVERVGEATWRALARPGRKLREGARVDLARGLGAEVVAVEPDGKRIVRFTHGRRSRSPPKRRSARPSTPPARSRSRPTSSARPTAPTASAIRLFSRARRVPWRRLRLDCISQVTSSQRVEAQGVQRVQLTLHVGYGTFEPVKAEDLSQHRVAAERIEVTPEAAGALNAARERGGRIVAVGTTSTRALETSADDAGRFHAASGPTDLTVTPGYRFRGVDALLTNFHLPQSSLLVLTATFGGLGHVMRAYRHAVQNAYRFYSYGDCMLIVE